jgi:hypothetical protein
VVFDLMRNFGTRETSVRGPQRLFVYCLMMSVGGCGGDPKGLAPVSGTVTYNGKPLANASLAFLPDEQGARGASGTTDANGSYRLTTFESFDGAKVGKHRVAIQCVEKVSFDELERIPTPEEQRTGKPPPKSLSPARYRDVNTSGLTADVVAGKKNVFDFALTD